MERDYLTKQIFPEIRQACRSRLVEFTEIDLRWGVTAEEAEQGRVVRICLEEIDRCRPYFLSFLGERYGWSPSAGDLTQKAELIRDYPFVEPSLREGKSVTEMEIFHGVLETPAMAEHCFFYFRDSALTRALAEQAGRNADFFEDSPAGREKLELLKARIRRRELPLRDNYGSLASLGEAVRADLLGALDRSFPAAEVPTPAELERNAHRAYAEDRSKTYVPNATDLAYLDNWLEQPTDGSPRPPLVVWGISGSGKSSLLAYWLSQLRERSPNRFIVEHYAGITGDATPSSIFYRIMGEIRARIGADDEIPTTPDKVFEAFPSWLARVRSEDPLLLLLDGLNQIEEDCYRWLQVYWPANVKLVLSTLPTVQLEALQRRQWDSYQIAPLDMSRRARIIRDYLAVYRKSLSTGQIDRLASAAQCANPLFLKLLLLELRVFGSFERLDWQISHLLAATDPEALFELILARMEKDYGKKNVGAAMSAISCARKGLTESELLGYTGLSRLSISILLLAFDYQLSRRNGHLGFFHDYLRQAVNRRYIETPRKRQRMHSQLADYFAAQAPGDRRIEEQPWQLAAAGKKRALKNCLTTRPMFEGIFSKGRTELLGYWRSLKDVYDPGQSYRRAAKRWQQERCTPPEELAETFNRIGEFLANECASYRHAEYFFLWAKRSLLPSQAPNEEALARILGNLAVLRRDKGDYPKARQDCEQAIRIQEKLASENKLPLLNNLNVLAGLYYAMGEAARTEGIYRQIIGACESEDKATQEQLALALNDLAFVLRNRGRYSEAEVLLRRGLAIREHLFGLNDPVVATSLNNLAELLRAREQLDEAEQAYRRALEIRTSLLGPTHPTVATILDNLSTILQARQQFDAAEAMSRQAVQIRTTILGPNHPNLARGLTNLADILCDRKQFDEALTLAQEALSIRERQLGPEHPDVATTLCELGKIHLAQGSFPQALSALERVQDIREAKLGEMHPLLAESLVYLAEVYSAMGNSAEAKPRLKRALDISQNVLGADDKKTLKIRVAYAALDA